MMRWKTRKDGDTRIVHRFAWLPVECDDGETIWLENYCTREVWRAEADYHGHDEWHDKGWNVTDTFVQPKS